MEKTNSDTANRGLRIIRMLSAPIDLVWEVWTKPEHIANWWGPNGFTGKDHQLDATVDGTYKMSFTNFSTGQSHSFGGK